jgi:hypothetical protein
MFPVEPSNSIAPSQTNDCEVYDSATSSCHSTSGGPLWRVTIRIGANRMEACGF